MTGNVAALLSRNTQPDQPELQALARARAREVILAAMGTIARAGARGLHPSVAIREDMPMRERALVHLLTGAALADVAKAVQDPARTDVDTWAAELVRTTVGALVDLLQIEGSALMQLPTSRYELTGYASITVPFRSGGSPNLGAAFRAEGAPARVGALSLSAQPLKPKALSVIGSSTIEMLNAAAPGVLMQIMRSAMISDTSKFLDSVFFGSGAGDAVTPAGILNGIAAADTVVSSGTTDAAIAKDLRGRYDQLLAHGYGSPATRWTMNSTQAASLAERFDEVRLNGTYLRIPVLAGVGVPAGVVILGDFAAVALGVATPEFSTTTEAVIHEESDPAGVLPIASGDAGAGVVAVPSRSLFQTHAAAMFMNWPIDWVVGGAGAIQSITGVAW